MDFVSNKQFAKSSRCHKKGPNKRKIGKQLSGQTANSTPFMTMEDTAHPGKKVSINPQDSIGEKLENLTLMMYKMSNTTRRM